MKLVCCLFGSLLLAAPAVAVADPDLSQANETDNPYAQYDPDGVPLTITQGKRQRAPTPAEMEAYRKQQEQIAYNKNWLLRGYEEQLRLHEAPNSANKDADTSSNLYYQLSLNKDLARLARLPDLDADNLGDGLALKVNPTPSGNHPTTLRTDASSSDKTQPLTLDNYKPLITPMSALDAITEHPSYSSFKPSTPLSPFADVDSQPTPAPKPATDATLDSVDLQTPGMVAAKSDSLSDPSLTDLNLDIQPGETPEQARARIEATENPQLSIPMNADELHREQTAAMAPPNPAGLKEASTGTTTTPQPPVAQPAPQVDEAPMPVSKMPQINPVRSPIPNPYDILNR